MATVRTSVLVLANIILVPIAIFFACNREFPCLVVNCPVTTYKCMLDSDCLNAAMCIGDCGANMNCTYRCLASYENDIFNNWLQCGISEQKCIIPETDPNQAECSVPHTETLSKEFELSKLLGKWYVVYGLNPIYDCFNKQWCTYEEKDNETLYLQEYYDVVALNESVRTFRIREDFGYVDATTSKAVLSLRSLDAGVFRDDEFRVLTADPTWSRYVLIYYCGMCSSVRYEGAIVYSRDPVLNDVDRAALSVDMEKYGWTLDQFCPVLHPGI